MVYNQRYEFLVDRDTGMQFIIILSLISLCYILLARILSTQLYRRFFKLHINYSMLNVSKKTGFVSDKSAR